MVNLIATMLTTLNHHAANWPSLLSIPPHRRNLDHVLRIEIDQLEPIFRDVGWRENIVLVELRHECLLQIALADSFVVAWIGDPGSGIRNRALDCQPFCPFHDRSDDRPA